jgi:hypothetical protein
LNMNPYTLSFIPGPATGACILPEPLGVASTFGAFSGVSLTNEGQAAYTIITGDLAIDGAASSITGLHDSVPVSYTETCGPATQGTTAGCGLVTGTIYSTGGVATAVHNDASTAYGNLAPAVRTGGLNVVTNSLIGAGGNPDELGLRTLAPGVYHTTGVATYQISTGDLTLDAQGNANAVWVFQADSSLTVSVPGGSPPTNTIPRSVNLINGAQAKNVFWYVGTAATINAGSTMVGTIISSAATTFGFSDTRANPTVAPSRITTLNGRAMSLNAGLTMVNTVINVPAP